MPYNTRRKSLSLPSLGIQLPNTSRAHRLNSKSVSNKDSQLPPPPKRVKRTHDDGPPSPASSTRSKVTSSTDPIDARPRSRREAVDHTPPPSPGDSDLAPRIDTEGINDDIVIAVIEQLEKTGNRPHLIKELATVLAPTNDSVAQYVDELSTWILASTLTCNLALPILPPYSPHASASTSRDHGQPLPLALWPKNSSRSIPEKSSSISPRPPTRQSRRTPTTSSYPRWARSK